MGRTSRASPKPRVVTSGARWVESASQRGELLIELLITVTIISLGVVAIISSVGSTFRMSGVSRIDSRSDQLLVRYAENLIAAPYQTCSGGTAPYAAAATSAIPTTNLPDGITVGAPGTASGSNAYELSIESVAYWNGDLAPATFSTTCPSTDLGSQELTLLVRAGDGSDQRTMMIVKRAS